MNAYSVNSVNLAWCTSNAGYPKLTLKDLENFKLKKMHWTKVPKHRPKIPLINKTQVLSFLFLSAFAFQSLFHFVKL